MSSAASAVVGAGLLLTVLLSAGVPAPASATSLAPLTVDQLVDASDAIVVGTVRGIDAVIDPTNRVYTQVEIEVERGLKGLVGPGDWLTVESPGGVLDAHTITEVGLAARYSVEERVLLFLNEKRFGTAWGTVGMTLGKYTIKQNPATAADMIVRFTLPYSQNYDARFIPNPPVGERVSLQAMEHHIESRLELGWDGRSIPGVSDDHLRAINKLQMGVK